MIIPIRCYTCGKVTGNLWDRYLGYLQQGKNEKEALTMVGCNRYCCRRELPKVYFVFVSVRLSLLSYTLLSLVKVLV